MEEFVLNRSGMGLKVIDVYNVLLLFFGVLMLVNSVGVLLQLRLELT